MRRSHAFLAWAGFAAAAALAVAWVAARRSPAACASLDEAGESPARAGAGAIALDLPDSGAKESDARRPRDEIPPVAGSSPAASAGTRLAARRDERRLPIVERPTEIRALVTDVRGVPMPRFEASIDSADADCRASFAAAAGESIACTDGVYRGRAWMHGGMECDATLTLEACGYEPRRVDLHLVAGVDLPDLRIVLVSVEPEVYGQVVDTRGRGIAGAGVVALPEPGGEGPHATVTDERGWFQLECARGTQTRSLLVTHPDHARRTVESREVGGTWAGVRIAMNEGGILRGVVLDAYGKAAAGVRVQASAKRADAAAPGRLDEVAFTRDDGSFTLERLPDGDCDVDFWRLVEPGRYGLVLTEPVSIADGRTLAQTFRLPAPRGP